MADLERLGAQVVEAEIPPPEADTWPMFEHEAAVSHRETFPSRADDYGYTIRPKLERAQDVQARGRRGRVCRRPRVAALRADGRPLRCARASRASCRPRTSTNATCAFRLSAFVRWVNLVGWAALAIGNLQLIAPRDETVLAAGLAWEQA